MPFLKDSTYKHETVAIFVILQSLPAKLY